MTEWPIVRFEEIAADEKSSFSKPYGSAFTKDDYVSDGVPLVRGVNLGNGVYHDDDYVFITDEKADKLPGANLAPGDLVITHRGTIGQVSMIPRSPRYPRYVLSTSQVKARLDPSRAVPEFYYYWLLSPAGQHEILSHVSTVGVPGLVQPVASVKGFKVPNPSLWEQRAATEVLAALDDKIAINERIAAGAIELADAHFTSAAQELNFGPDTFGSAAKVVGGGTPSTKTEKYWGGGIAWTTPTDVTALSAPYLFETGRTVTGEGLENCASQLYPAQSIFMTSRATIGAFALPQIPAAVNQGFIVVLPPTEELRWWLLHEMRSRVEEMISLANGSTFLELSRKNFKAMPIRLASDQALANFAQAVAPLHRRASQATAESRSLASLRDTLLPQLMSGKLRVRDAEKIVENAV
ncbi:restriction endonuclease subunit S [Streptomyces sp. NPDC088197]|uniref:restriction endonuclease subunit S n=1 Tax=Streptomyces sp. NPDC088197 TaxID=3365840 RepID=UPI0038171531